MGTLQIDNDIDSKALTSSKQIFARYRVYRELSGKLVNDELFGYIGEDTIKMVAKKFGLIKNKTLILNSDVELAILMNFCLFHYYGLDGKRAIDRYALNKLNVLQSDKKIMTLAMRESHFSILLVEEVRPHNGIVVNDLLYNQKELLIDRALSKTVAPNTILASTLLRFPEFIMTTGAAFPLHNINNKLESVVNKYTKDNNTFKTMSQKEKNLFIADIYKWCFSEEVFDFVNYKKFG